MSNSKQKSVSPLKPKKKHDNHIIFIFYLNIIVIPSVPLYRFRLSHEDELLHNLSQIRRQSEQMPPAYANVFRMSLGLEDWHNQTDNRSHKRQLLVGITSSQARIRCVARQKVRCEAGNMLNMHTLVKKLAENLALKANRSKHYHICRYNTHLPIG